MSCPRGCPPSEYCGACLPVCHGECEEAEAWRDNAQLMAATNARLCEIVLAADKLEEASERVVVHANRSRWARLKLQDALLNYKAVKQGQ